MDIYESKYQENGGKISDDSMNAYMFLLVTWLEGLRGFNTIWTDLATLTYDIEYCESMDD